MQRRKRERNRGSAARLEMTPMIDVVFLLLVFFVVTIQPQDVVARLNVSRPAAPPKSPQIPLLRIDVGVQGYVINGRLLSLETIKKKLTKLYVNASSSPLIVASTGDAPHSRLVKLLDMCAGIGIPNISLMSM
jgi:biopolymer transport protein ExbD